MKGKWQVKKKLKLQFTEAEAGQLQRELSQLRLLAKERLPGGTQYPAVDEFIDMLERPS